MEFSVEIEDAGGGFLVEERLRLLAVSERLREIATTDNSSLTRAEIADLITDLVASTEQAAVVAGRFVAFGEHNTCALTKGSKSMTPLLTSTCRVSRARARQLRRAGLASERFPHFHRALMDGQITMAHIDVVQPVWRTVNSRQFNAAQASLAHLATMCTPEEFKDYLTEWEAVSDPDEHLDEFIRAQAQQHLLLQYDLNGNLHLTGTIGPLHAEPFAQTVLNRAEPIKAENPDRYRSATAMDALVDLVLNPDGKYRAHLEILDPTGGQPQPDTTPDTSANSALTDQQEPSAEQALSSEQARARANRIRVHRDPGFAARYYPRTTKGTLIPPAITQQLAATARVRHHQLDPNGNIATDTPAGRHFTTTQKRLIQLRDHHCQHPGCHTPAQLCDTDHKHPWNTGGPTLISNSQLLCRFHHRYKHRDNTTPNTTQTRIFNNTPLTIQLVQGSGYGVLGGDRRCWRGSGVEETSCAVGGVGTVARDRDYRQLLADVCGDRRIDH